MAALTQDRNTVERSGNTRSGPVAAGAVLFAGALVAVNAAGNLVAGSTATGLKGFGRSEARFDNTGGAAGAITAEVRTGVFRFANSAAADAITRADVGATAYIVDDQTVAKTDGSGTRSPAGTIYDIDAQGVWVEF